MNTRCPEQMGELLTDLGDEGDLDGHRQLLATRHHRQPFRRRESISSALSPLFVSSKRSPSTTPSSPASHLITANAQPAPGTPLRCRRPGRLWGLGRVIGHQEFSEHWGGLIDIDPDTDSATDRAETAARICEHLLGDGVRRSDCDPRPNDIRPAATPVQQPDETVPHQAHPRCDLCRHRRSGSARPRRGHLPGRTWSTPHHAAEPKHHPVEKPLAGTD